MKTKTLCLSAVFAILQVGAAFGEDVALPKSAKQLSGEEISKFMDGKTFNVTIHDADAPIFATTNWNWKKKSVTGSYEYKGTKGTFDNQWTINGDRSCGEKDSKGKLICQKIFVDGDVVYEVNRKGKVHAVSKLAN